MPQEHTDVAQVKVLGEVIVVHSTRSALHTDAKQHRLLLCDAVAISNQSYLGRGVLQKVIAHLAILGQFRYALYSFEQSRKVFCFAFLGA